MKHCKEANQQKLGPGLMADHTGFFVSWEKSHLLIQTIQEVLHTKFQTVAKIGRRLPNNTAEIILYAKQSSGASISGAKNLLENYLKMVDECRPNGFVEKKPEVIELDVEEEITCIVLDDSVNESVFVPLINDVTCRTNCDDERRNSSTGVASGFSQIIVIESPDEVRHSSISKLVNGSSQSSVGDETQQGLKRKNPFSDGEDVVEILDDDVVVLDDSFSSKNQNDPNKKRLNNNFHSETLIDLTKIGSPPTATSWNKPSHISDNCINFVKYPEKNESKLRAVNQISTTSCNSKLSSLVSHRQNEASLFIDPACTSTPKSSKSVSLLTNETSTSSKSSSESCSANSTIGISSKRASKLAYKRPPHLLDPLTKSSSSTQMENSQSNIYNPNAGLSEKRTGLRPIVIDGNNVAISHGKGQFSLKGIQICINFFEKRGHRQIKAFVPHYRINRDSFEALHRLERQGTVVITPSRKVDSKVVASYDDRYIVQYAAEFGGVIVSTDNYRDLMQENSSWKETIAQRLLMFTWIDDLLMFPQDPLGRNGPTLDTFLKFPDS